jgi:hypothetical protein
MRSSPSRIVGQLGSDMHSLAFLALNFQMEVGIVTILWLNLAGGACAYGCLCLNFERKLSWILSVANIPNNSGLGLYTCDSGLWHLGSRD